MTHALDHLIRFHLPRSLAGETRNMIRNRTGLLGLSVFKLISRPAMVACISIPLSSREFADRPTALPTGG
jgi:hypothetical protein